MALCVCKCLNVSLECEKIVNNIDIGKLDLPPVEQRDNFFNEQLLMSQGLLKTSVSQPALTGQKLVGQWTLHFCLACNQTTHATAQGQNMLINKNTVTTANDVNNLKRTSRFSTVFKLLIPEGTSDIDMQENINTNNLNKRNKNVLFNPLQEVIGSLNKQLSQTLQSELEAVEEAVRQFRDLKYAEFEVYREKAQRDHKILASIVSKSRGNVDVEGWRTDGNDDKGPLSPQLPPLQRRRLSSLKDAKKFQRHTVKIRRNFPPEEDSLDAEDIFDLEGTDSNMSRNDMNSDQDDYDSDDSVSYDEGIPIARGRGSKHSDIARSLPINVPKFPKERSSPGELDDEEDPQDIAASIKALARSVHGDVFGELPRPRFTTQI